MIYRLLHFIRGYYLIELKAPIADPVLDLAYRRGVRFWGIRKLPDGTLCVKIRARELALFHNSLSAFSINPSESMRVLERGLPQMLRKRKDRVGIVLGIFFGIFLLWLSTFYVWSVTIDVDSSVYPDSEILSDLLELGIRSGMLKSDLDEPAAQVAFLQRHPEYSFAAFNLRGTRLTVSLVTRTNPPETEDIGASAHLIAKTGGIVIGMEVIRGQPVVSVGDVVNEGDLLVSGAMSLREGGYRVVESRGKVFLQTFHEFSCKIPFSQEIERMSGKQSVRTETVILGHALNLADAKTGVYPLETCVEETEQVSFLGLLLPIYRHRYTHIEKQLTTLVRDKDGALRAAYDAYHDWLMRLVGEDGELLSEEVSFTENADGICFQAQVFLKENAAQIQPFTFHMVS